MVRSTRERLVAAAFELFDEQGYDVTTVDEIAARAGTGRTTFFRYFRGKEEVVFPDHDGLLAAVDARLTTATDGTREMAVRESARIVLEHYLDEGDTAYRRYRLTSRVPALRNREISSVYRYQHLFARHAQTWFAPEPDGDLRGELLGAAVVTAHNFVLRNWLRRTSDTPREDFDAAMAVAWASTTSGRAGKATVVTITSGTSVEEVVSEVRRALQGG